jgi:two-component system LytT family response regulator
MSDHADVAHGRIRTLVVDDEQLARAGLKAMLASDRELVVEECASGRDAILMLSETAFDLVLLDVQMPKINGFEVIEAIGSERMPVVVFTTAYGEYALQAFDACALDYVLKPIDDARLAKAVGRAKELVRRRREAPSVTRPVPLQRVLLRSGDASYYVDVDDIDWIESDTYYARLWTHTRSHLIRQSLTQLEAQLDPRTFVRVHRTAIVNIRRVAAIRRLGLSKYAVTLVDGRQITLSRERRRALHEALRTARSS